MQQLFYVLFLYCVISRLLELVYSSFNRRRLSQSGFQSMERTTDFRPMAILHGMWLVCTLLEAVAWPTVMPAISMLALLVFLFAQVGRYWVLAALGTHWNVGVMAPDSPRSDSFVSHGPYRYMRHPNYFVVIVEIATLPLIGGAVWSALLFSVANGLVLKNRIACEDAHLFSRPGYRETMGNKPALPFLPFFNQAR